jgi:hypothetical protein
LELAGVAYEWQDGLGLLKAKVDQLQPHFNHLRVELPKYKYKDPRTGIVVSLKVLIKNHLNTIASEE